MPQTIEHRAAPRQIAVNDQTYVHLMGWDGAPITRGRLLNLSNGGALIRVDNQVGRPEWPLWIRLERAPETGWLAADVARRDRPEEVAIRFHGTCPLEFFLAATLGGFPRRSADSRSSTPGRDELGTLSRSWNPESPTP
jgi:hypothetical protein